MLSIKKIFRIAWRERKLMANNQLAMMIFLGGPLLYALLVGFVYKDASIANLPIGIVDLDGSPLSAKIADALDDSQYLRVDGIYKDRHGLDAEVMNKQLQAVVIIPERFEADAIQRRHPEIAADINGSNMLTANYASSAIQTVLGTINAGAEIEALKKQGMPEAAARDRYEIFKVQQTRFYNSSSNYLVFLWPGMLGTIMQQVFLLVLALSFASEFEKRTFGRLLAKSGSPFRMVVGKTLFYWSVGMVLWISLVAVLFPAFNMPEIKHWGAFMLSTGIFMLSVSFLGIAASIVFNTSLKATEVLMILATPSFIISGQTWPLCQMPAGIRAFSQSMPLTHYLESFRKILLQGASISDISFELGMMSILAGIFFCIAVGALWFAVRKYRKQLAS